MDTPEIHAFFEDSYDAQLNRITIGTCKCRPNNTVHIFNVDQAVVDMTVGCAKKLHDWKGVKKAVELHRLSTRMSLPPAMSLVKTAVHGWMAVIPGNLDVKDRGEPQAVVTKVIHVQQMDSEDSPAMPVSASASSETCRGGMDVDGHSGDDGPAALLSGDDGDDGSRSSESADESFTIEQRKSDKLRELERPWFVFLPTSAGAVKCTAAVLTYLAKLIALYGIPASVNGFMLFHAWKEGNGLAVARALEGMTLMLWPQAWIDQNVMNTGVFDAMKAMLTTDLAVAHAQMLYERVQRVEKPLRPYINQVDASSATPRRELDRAVVQRSNSTTSTVAQAAMLRACKKGKGRAIQ